MPDAVEAAAPAPGAGYSLTRAADDLIGGAFRPRLPPRRQGSEPLGWGRQAVLVAGAGFVGGIDVYVREPFKPVDVPAEWVGWLPLLNVVGNPAIAILVSLVTWLVSVAGGRLIAFGRFGARQLASGLAFGWWSATLPVLAAIALGMASGLKSDVIALVVVFLLTIHMVPSVAETSDLTIGQACAVVLLGPIAAVIVIVLALLGFGFTEKLIGIRL